MKLFKKIKIFICIYLYECNNIEKKAHKFEREKGVMYGKDWSKEREGRNDAIGI